MIFPSGLEPSFRNSVLICLRKSIDEATFLSKAKAKPGTYAENLFANLYDDIFRRSLELKRDYADYYQPEYGTFEKYVQKRFLFSSEVVSAIVDHYPESVQIIFFEPRYAFLEEGYGIDFLKRLFEPTERI